jgi:hypothetical protein
MPDSMTQILNSGPPGAKTNIAVLGDGFTEADQAAYSDRVRELLLEGVFANDYFHEDMQAFNIFQVNLISNESGVSQRVYNENGTPSNGSDDTIISTTLRDTALGYIYSGSWAHCWVEAGPDSATRIQDALDTWVPDYDFVLIILNEMSFGGCASGTRLVVTRGSSWAVTAHEFGHGLGALADEYCRPGTYSGEEPGAVNVTANNDAATLKWRRFVHPATPVPTGINPNPGNGACTPFNQGTKPADWSAALSAGLFEGAQYRDSGKYRPAENCRMRGNSPPFCPVCYTAFKERYHATSGHSFLTCYAGDFNGDGRDDLLIHNVNGIQIFRSDGTQLDHVFSAVDRVPGSWQFRSGDRFLIGDFNGDGKDEVVVYNSVDWSKEYLGLLVNDGSDGLELVARYDDSMPGWQFQMNDRFYLADFDGNGSTDLIVFNGSDWAIPYLGMLRSSGSGFSVVQRYDNSMPGWSMRPGDRHYIGDFNGDGRDDVWVFNGGDWAFPYLGMLRSNGADLSMSRRYDGTMPGWDMRAGDRHYVGDFNSDGRSDLYVFNGDDWAIAYLGLLSSTGAGLNMVRRYDGNAPGWQMRRHDQHFLADFYGDGKADLWVYNHQDWSGEYLGMMVNNGTALDCSWQHNQVGEWNLGAVDRLVPCNYEGGATRRNLFIHNQDWFGLIKGRDGGDFSTGRRFNGLHRPELQRIYYRWIHNYRYGRNW